MQATTTDPSHALFDSSPDLDRAEILRERLRDEGYLFFRGLLPVDPVAELHRRFAAIAAEAGWIDADGRALPGEGRDEVDPAYQHVYRRMFHDEHFHRLLHQRTQIALLRRLVDGPVLPHPRGIIRAMFPSEAPSTAPHQDFFYTQGSANHYAMWIPLHRCPRHMGSLEIAVGSHRHGLFATGDDLGPGGGEADGALAGTWCGADFEVGDTVLFHSMTVHRAGANQTDRLRLSVDYRYQSRAEAICPVSMALPQYLLDAPCADPWEDIYAGWGSRELCFFWKRWPLVWAPLDPTLMRDTETRALEVGERGDPRARPFLVRVAKLDPSPTRREHAVRLLHAFAAKGHAGVPEGFVARS